MQINQTIKNVKCLALLFFSFFIIISVKLNALFFILWESLCCKIKSFREDAHSVLRRKIIVGAPPRFCMRYAGKGYCYGKRRLHESL